MFVESGIQLQESGIRLSIIIQGKIRNPPGEIQSPNHLGLPYITWGEVGVSKRE